MALFLSDKLPADHRIVRLSNAAFRLYITSLCFAKETDKGTWVSPYVLNGKSSLSRPARELLSVGLWEKRGDWYYAVKDGPFSILPLFSEIESRRKRARRLRDAVVARDGMVCGICEEPITDATDLHIDHVVPLKKGGSSDLANLRPTHSSCNIRKGARLQ